MRFTYNNLYRLSERVLEEALNDPDKGAEMLSELLVTDCQKWNFWQKTKLYECVFTISSLQVASVEESFESLRNTPAVRGWPTRLRGGSMRTENSDHCWTNAVVISSYSILSIGFQNRFGMLLSIGKTATQSTDL